MTDHKPSIETEKEKSGNTKAKPRTILAERSEMRTIELASRSKDEADESN